MSQHVEQFQHRASNAAKLMVYHFIPFLCLPRCVPRGYSTREYIHVTPESYFVRIKTHKLSSGFTELVYEQTISLSQNIYTLFTRPTFVKL